MKKALIFGVAGQDGAYLSELLLDKGYTVVGASRDAQTGSFSRLDALGIRSRVQLESVSIYDFRSVLQTLSRIRPDEVYNLAGPSSVELSFDQPVETMEAIAVGTLNLLEAIRFSQQPIKLYSAGSSECFGNTTEPATESAPFRPRSPYAVGKAAAFWEVATYREAYGLFACTGILFNHESPLRPERFVTKKIVSAAARIASGSSEKLGLGNIKVRRDWGWAPEYVCAMWEMLRQPEADDYVIATGKSWSIEEFAAAAFAYFGLDSREHIVLDDRLLRPSDIHFSVGDPAKAAAVLGWVPRSSAADVVAMMAAAEAERLLADLVHRV